MIQNYAELEEMMIAMFEARQNARSQTEVSSFSVSFKLNLKAKAFLVLDHRIDRKARRDGHRRAKCLYYRNEPKNEPTTQVEAKTVEGRNTGAEAER